MPPSARTVEVRNIVSVDEILKMAGKVMNGSMREPIPRSTLRRWREKHDFPAPFKTVGRRTELFDASEIRPWLEAWKARRDEAE